MRVTANRLWAPACALTLPLCVLAIWPVLELGICDEWSIFKTVQILDHTGRIVYNGWEAAMLGWQLYLGVAFAKLFGFSFTAVRLSILPVAMATALVTHRVLVRCGINEWNATLGTAALVLSPLFLPLAATFMTDVPALFCLVLCLYACLRALQANTDNSAIAWICFAAVANAIGGTVRQIAWLGVLVMVPSTLWLLRRRRHILMIGGLVYLVSVAFIYGALHWFSRQPYSVPEHLIQGEVSLGALIHGMWTLLLVVPELAALLLPVLLFFIPGVPFGNRRAVTVLASCGVLVAAYLFLVAHRDLDWRAPYFETGSYIHSHGITPPDTPYGLQPVLLNDMTRIVVTCLAAFATVCFVTVVLFRTVELPGVDSRRHSRVSWRQLAVVLAPFALTYYALLLPRATFANLYDRYVLSLLFVALIVILRCYEEKVQPRLPAAAFLTIALYAAFGVVGTHDAFARHRAFLVAINELRGAGIPPTEIDGGWEYNGWNQIEFSRYINDPKITALPGDRFRPSVAKRFGICRPALIDEFSVIWPRYALAMSPADCLGEAGFPPVRYHTWLSPQWNTLYIVKVGRPGTHRPLDGFTPIARSIDDRQ